MILFEEVLISKQLIKKTLKMAKLRKKWRKQTLTPPKFNILFPTEQATVRDYYNIQEKRLTQRLRLLSMASSIQLSFQTARLMTELVNPPLLDLDYQTPLLKIASSEQATVRWILFKIMFLIVKILLSGISTLKPLINHEKMRLLINNGKADGAFLYVSIVLKAVCHLVLGSGCVFLERTQNFLS